MSTADAGLDTVVAGLRCRDVLDDLSDLLDGALPAARVTAIQAHLAGCNRCAQFGGAIAQTLAHLRTALREPPPISSGQAAQLQDALRRVQGA
jgi:anti-sigma factor RsiW